MTKQDLIVRHEPPPIPIRNFDWSAVEDDYEPGRPIGWGRTRHKAILDLLDQLEYEVEDE